MTTKPGQLCSEEACSPGCHSNFSFLCFPGDPARFKSSSDVQYREGPAVSVVVVTQEGESTKSQIFGTQDAQPYELPCSDTDDTHTLVIEDTVNFTGSICETNDGNSKDGLSGVWSYADGQYMYKLTLLAGVQRRYLFQEQHADGKLVEATLSQNGEWYEGSLSQETSHELGHFGFLRLRLHEGQIISSFRTTASKTWGEECFASPDGLEGTWSYEGGMYKITALERLPLRYTFEEQHTDGSKVEGLLRQLEDKSYQGSVSTGGEPLGDLRMRRQDGKVISCFRREGDAEWGDDSVAIRRITT